MTTVFFLFICDIFLSDTIFENMLLLIDETANEKNTFYKIFLGNMFKSLMLAVWVY